MTLTLHDAAVAARDPGLPGLALLLDADRLAAVLAKRLPDCGLVRLRPSYLRYKPETSCLAGFIAETAFGRVDLAAKAYKPRRYAVERIRSLPDGLGSVVGPIALALDDAAVMVRIVPYDRDLEALPRLVDPDRRARFLGKLVPMLEGCSWRVLRHKPGRRHIGVLVADGRTRAIVKLYAAAHFDQARLGARFAAGNGGPALLGCSRRHGVLASAWQPGRSLAEIVADDPLAAESVAAAGRALAAVHDCWPGDLQPRPLGDAAAAVLAAADSLARLAPDLAAPTLRLAGQVAELVLAAPGRPVPLHGDFSADQVVVGQDGVRLIDWDRAGTGPRGFDLGSFIARLEADALALGKPRPEALRARFADAYAGTAGRRPEALRLWTAAALLRLAGEPFRQRRPDWPKLTRALLARVERHVARAVDRSTEKPRPRPASRPKVSV